MDPWRLMNFVMIAIFVAAIVWLYRGDKEAGHVRTVTWLFLGATSMSWMESVWDWVLYYRFNPEQFWLMPEWIPVLGMGGGLPYIMPTIYGPWFVLVNFATAVWMVQRNFSLKQIFVGALVLGALEELILEIPFLLIGTYSYTRALPGFHIFEGQAQYPLDVPLLMAPVMAFITVFIAVAIRREQARAAGTGTPSNTSTFFGRMRELRAFGGTDDRKGINAICVIIAAHLVFLMPMIPALIMRVTGLKTDIGDATAFGLSAYPFPM